MSLFFEGASPLQASPELHAELDANAQDVALALAAPKDYNRCIALREYF
jgi:hypothetical protein